MGYEDLSVYHAALESIEKVKRVWEVTPDMIAGSVWYTIFQQYWKIADTVPLRYKRNGQVIALTPSQASTTIAGGASAPPIDHEIVERDLQATSDTVLDARIDIKLDHIEAMDVEDTQCWMPLCAWMRKKYEWHDDRDWTQRGGRQLQLENQITWWKCNGKHFNFLALPGELRNAVYSESLGPGIDNPNTQILLVTRDIQAEAVAAWVKSTKRVSLSSSWTGFSVANIKELAPPSSLNRVQLELPAVCYFELIGIRPQPGAPFASLDMDSVESTLGIAVLRSLPNLRHLDLCFIAPTHPDARCPWGALALQRGVSTGHSCQKTWIDWFFTFALEHFIGWDVRITMSGCVKSPTRAKWEPMIKKARNANIGDMAAEQEAIRLVKQDDLPLKCSCAVPCSS